MRSSDRLKEYSAAKLFYSFKLGGASSATPLLGMLFFVLSVRPLRLRRKLQIAIGDADNQQLLRAMRIHSNFAGERRACGSFSHG